MVPKMWNQGSNFVTGSKYGTLEPVLGTGSAISAYDLTTVDLPRVMTCFESLPNFS